MSPLVTYVRCRMCSAEQTIIGPSTIPTYEYPGWTVSAADFYQPHGAHFCPQHARRRWIAFCGDVVTCEACLSDGERVVTAPSTLAEEQVVDRLNERGVTCRSGNPIFGVEAAEESGESYTATMPEFDL